MSPKDSFKINIKFFISQHTPLYIVYGIPRCIPQNKIWGFVFGVCKAKLPTKREYLSEDYLELFEQ